MKKILLFIIALVTLNISTFGQEVEIAAGDVELINALGDVFHAELGWAFDPATKKVIADSYDDLPGIVFSPLGYVWEINFPNKGLTGVIPSEDEVTPPEGVGVLTQCYKIDISGNPGITGTLPAVFVKDAATLETLNLAGTGLSGQLTNGVTSLKFLKSLNISETDIETLPSAIGDLAASLTEFKLNDAELRSLPESFGQLVNIGDVLNLSDNKLTTLPEGIGGLTQLKEINLKNNKLESLPENIGKLVLLKELDLSDQELASLPEGIGGLTQLEKLLIDENKLTTLPNGLGSLTQLTVLDISENELSTLPSTIGGLVNLSTFKLADNSFTSLPDGIGLLGKVGSLDFSGASLTTVPENLAGMSKLITLKLNDNEFTVFPKGLYTLPSIRVLNLTGNAIVGVEDPGTIGKNTSLSSLNLTGSKLDICGLENLAKVFPVKPTGYELNVTIASGTSESKQQGESVTFKVADICGENNKYQWEKANELGQFKEIEGATTNVLTISDVKKADEGDYRCYISNNVLDNKLYAKGYSLTVLEDLINDFNVTLNENSAGFQILGTKLVEYLKKYNQYPDDYTVEITTAPEHGTFVFGNDQTLNGKYTPNTGYFGNDIIVVKVSAEGRSNSGTITLTVENINTKPTVTLQNSEGQTIDPFVLNTNYGEPLKFKAILQDQMDGDFADDLKLNIASSSYGSTVSYDATTNEVSYTAGKNETGDDIIVFYAEEVNDGLKSNAAKATIKVTFVDQNTAPIASNQQESVELGKTINFEANASDKETALANLNFEVTSSPSKAAFFAISEGKITYKPNASGEDVIKYKVTDKEGLSSEEATITINITEPPVINIPDQEVNVYTYFYKIYGYSYNYYSNYNNYAYGYGNYTQLTNKPANTYIQLEYNSNEVTAYSYSDQIYLTYNRSYLINKNNSFGGYGFYTKGFLETHQREVTVNYLEYGTQRLVATQKVKLKPTGGNTYMYYAYQYYYSYYGRYYTRYYYSGYIPGSYSYYYNYYYQENKGGIKEEEFKQELIKEFELNKPVALKSTLTDPPGGDFPGGEPGGDTGEPTDVGGEITVDDPIEVTVTTAAQSDTVEAIVGEPLVITFSGDNAKEQLEMSIETNPSKGSISNFAFSAYEDNQTTKYTATYTATAGSVGLDSIVFIATSTSDADTATIYIELEQAKFSPTIAELTDQTIDEDNDLVIDLGIEDADTPIEDLTINTSITASVDGFNSTITNGSLTITPPANFNGSALVEITVIDTDNLSDYKKFTLTVSPVNDAPVLIAEDSYSADYNNDFVAFLSSSDAEKDAITMTVSNLPEWASFEAFGTAAGEISGSPKAVDAGDYIITVTLTDGTATAESQVKITVNGPDVDTPPSIKSAIAPVELAKSTNTISIDVSNLFTDVDGDEITLSIISNDNSDWITAELATDKINVNVADSKFTGNANLTIQAESNGLTTTSVIQIYTNDVAPKRTGIIDDVIVNKGSENVTIDLSTILTDQDGDVLTYTLVENTFEDGIEATIDGTNLVLSFINNLGGNASITIAGEAYGKTAGTSFFVTINDQKPYLSTPIDDVSMFKADDAITVDISSLFADDDDETIALIVGQITPRDIANVSIDGTSVTISAQGYASGIAAVQIVGITGNNTVNYTFEVEIIDKAPVVKETISDQMIAKNSTNNQIDLSNLFADEDDEIIILSVESNTNETAITTSVDGTTLYITAIENMAGDATLTIQGLSGGKTVTSTIKITIEDKAPVVNKATADQDAFKNGDNLVIDLAELFSDEDDAVIALEVLTISNSALVSATISGTQLTIEFENGVSGTSDITIQGSASGKTVSHTFTVTVTDRAPEAASIDDVKMFKDVTESINLNNYFSDPDGDAISYSVVSNSNESILTATISGSDLVINSKDQLGNAEITIKGTADGLEATTKVKVTVDKKTGIDNKYLSQLKVYPNPVNDVFTIQWNGLDQINNMQVVVTDISGRTIFNTSTASFNTNENLEIDLSNYSNGIYQVQIQSDQFRLNQRIIKQ